MQVPKLDNDTEKVYGHARDNAIAALGKIIKYQKDSLGAKVQNLVFTWFYLLPLKFDKPEAKA